jgi:hypothetical protein
VTRGIHTKPNRGATVEWLTPPEILRALGPFDLDPCAPAARPWDIAKRHYTKAEDGLSLPWEGVVWVNPPYSAKNCERWLRRLSEHGSGFALVAARTETDWFQRWVFGSAKAVLYLRGRLYFHKPDGTRASGNAGHGSVIAAYGMECVRRLAGCDLPGRLVLREHGLWGPPATGCVEDVTT